MPGPERTTLSSCTTTWGSKHARPAVLCSPPAASLSSGPSLLPGTEWHPRVPEGCRGSAWALLPGWSLKKRLPLPVILELSHVSPEASGVDMHTQACVYLHTSTHHTPHVYKHTHTRAKQKLVLFHSLCLEAVSELRGGWREAGYGRSFRVPSSAWPKSVAPDHHPVGLSGKGGQCLFGISSMCP